MPSLKKTIDPENITAIIDTREQDPLDLSPIKTIRGTLATGDYSIVGMTDDIAIERKSLPDLIQCIGRERDRFDKEIQRLLGYPSRAIVVEGTWIEIEQQKYRGEVHPNAALGSLYGWIMRGIPIIMAGDHQRAGRMVSRMLFIAARRQFNKTFNFVEMVSQELQNAGNQ